MAVPTIHAVTTSPPPRTTLAQVAGMNPPHSTIMLATIGKRVSPAPCSTPMEIIRMPSQIWNGASSRMSCGAVLAARRGRP